MPVPSVSVVIPAFNAEETLRETLESVWAQSRPADEIIVVDDGSTDSTPDILAQLAPRVRSIRIPNSGLPAVARNRGVEIATSDWIAFLDADDLWEPAKLESQLRAVQQDPTLSLVFTDRWNFGNDGRTTSRLSESVSLPAGDVFSELLTGNFVTTSSVLVKRDAFIAQQGFDEDPALRGCEDWDLWLRISAAGGLFGLCPKPLTSYRLHDGTVSNSHIRMCQGRVATVKRALASPRGTTLPRHLVREAMAHAWNCSAWHIAPVNRWRALQWYARSSWHAPRDISNYKGAIKCLIGRVD